MTTPTHTPLGPDDVLQEGDEQSYHESDSWSLVDPSWFDTKANDSYFKFRRPITNPKPEEAQPPLSGTSLQPEKPNAIQGGNSMQPPEVTPQSADGPSPLTPSAPSEGASETPAPQGLKEQLRREQLTRAGIMGNLQDRVVSNVGFDKLWDYFEKEKGDLEHAKLAAEVTASTESDLRDGMEKRCVHEIKLREEAEGERDDWHQSSNTVTKHYANEMDKNRKLRDELSALAAELSRVKEQLRDEKANQANAKMVWLDRMDYVRKEITALRLRGCAGTDFVSREEVDNLIARLRQLKRVGFLYSEIDTVLDAASATTTPEGKQQ